MRESGRMGIVVPGEGGHGRENTPFAEGLRVGLESRVIDSASAVRQQYVDEQVRIYTERMERRHRARVGGITGDYKHPRIHGQPFALRQSPRKVLAS
jgi:hypothetical protein